ncbi:MAG: peptidoglycan-binding domain-containing protein [Acidimicrobiales bacterium]
MATGLLAATFWPVVRFRRGAEVEFSEVWPGGRNAATAATVFTAAMVIMLSGTAAVVVDARANLRRAPAALAGSGALATSGSGADEAQLVDLSLSTTTSAAPKKKRKATANKPSPPAPAAAPEPVARRGALPVGKGMWIWLPQRSEGGDPQAIVDRALQVGLTHVYVRTGSSKRGFYAQSFLDQLLPVAHANGIRVYGWDFPYFFSWSADVWRAVEAITYTTPDGHRIDGFSADIETAGEGVRLSAHHAHEYGSNLRRLVGPDYPLIATVPRPNAALRRYPFAEVVASFDAVAPMVYWMHRDPVGDVISAIDYLSQFGKPVMPIGQAYDGGPEGGPGGVPRAEQLIRFMQAADAKGAMAVSFWSWQHADQQAWDGIGKAAEFRLHAGPPDALLPGMVTAYQGLLASLGFAVERSGIWDAATAVAVAAYQEAARLPVTGIIDDLTRALLLKPFSPPVQPLE